MRRFFRLLIVIAFALVWGTPIVQAQGGRIIRSAKESVRRDVSCSSLGLQNLWGACFADVRIMETFYPSIVQRLVAQSYRIGPVDFPQARVDWNLPKRTVVSSHKPIAKIVSSAGGLFTKKEVDAVIFDLDGTLLDSLWAWEHSGSNFVRSEGFEPPEDLDEKLVKLSLMDGAKLIKEMYDLPYTLEEILHRTLLPIKNRYLYEVQPMPGVPALLARLKAQGIKMAVATASYKDFAEASLKRLGLADYFEFIITCDEVGVGKTSPKVYEVAAARLGTSKARTLVAEDALHALQTAKKAGFKTAGIEEKHSVQQRLEKMKVADYYILAY